MTRRPFKLSGTFDIECSDWQRFEIGATYDGHLPRVYYNGDEMIDHMRARGGIWFAHAAGVYDGLYVLERFRERGIACQIDRSQHRVTRIVAGSLTIRDSYALWPVPLDEIAGALGVPVPSLPWKCICDRNCAGYCQIGPRAREGDPDLEEYVKADCRVLYDGITLLDEWAGERNIALRGTLGHTAWTAAQDELGVPESDITWDLYRYAKRADKGGRTAIIRPRARGPGRHHDICNAYPAQLAKTPLPVGACSQVGGARADRALSACRPGIYQLTVRVPDDAFLPPLPWAHGGQLTFPTGTFTGTWTLPELVCAFDRGVTIEKVHTALVWEATAPVFAELVRRWYDIRREAGRKTPLGQWIGRCAKALTGKLAERPERNRVVMHPDSIKVCLRQKSCRDGCTGRCGAYEQIDLFGHIYAIPYQHLGGSCYPQWSAYLRASTRVQWLEQAERFGTDLCFGNTDSIWSIGRMAPEPLGDGLGQWEYQGAWWDLEVRSPNTYAFRTAAPRDKIETRYVHGQRKRARVEIPGPLEIRGVPGLTEEDWKRGTGTIERGIVTFGAAVKSTKGLFRKRSRRWTLPEHERTIYGDRKISSGGVTYPLAAEEIRDLVRARRALR
jgi:hypothetical protein